MCVCVCVCCEHICTQPCFKVSGSRYLEFYQPHLLIDINFQSGLCCNPILHSIPQDGVTAVMLAARCGYQSLVQELCETFGADVLHRKKVRAMADCKWQ